MTRIDTKKLRELHAAGTQGEWCQEWLYGALRHIHKNVDRDAFFGEHCHQYRDFIEGRLDVPDKNDAALIVAMHESIPALLEAADEVERLRGALRQIAINPSGGIHATAIARAALARLEAKDHE